MKLFWVPVIQEMSYKEISYLELWRPLTIRAIFGKWHYEEQFCKNYYEFGPVVQM